MSEWKSHITQLMNFLDKDHEDVGTQLLNELAEMLSRANEPEVELPDYSSPLRPKTLKYTMCGKIYAVQEDGRGHMFLDVRGWGFLTGGGAKALPYEEAAAIQDKWALEICDLWNTPPETVSSDDLMTSVSQCDSANYCYGWNDAIDHIRAQHPNGIKWGD